GCLRVRARQKAQAQSWKSAGTSDSRWPDRDSSSLPRKSEWLFSFSRRSCWAWVQNVIATPTRSLLRRRPSGHIIPVDNNETEDYAALNSLTISYTVFFASPTHLVASSLH